jgi:hypothetical protein
MIMPCQFQLSFLFQVHGECKAQVKFRFSLESSSLCSYTRKHIKFSVSCSNGTARKQPRPSVLTVPNPRIKTQKHHRMWSNFPVMKKLYSLSLKRCILDDIMSSTKTPAPCKLERFSLGQLRICTRTPSLSPDHILFLVPSFFVHSH